MRQGIVKKILKKKTVTSGRFFGGHSSHLHGTHCRFVNGKFEKKIKKSTKKIKTRAQRKHIPRMFSKDVFPPPEVP